MASSRLVMPQILTHMEDLLPQCLSGECPADERCIVARIEELTEPRTRGNATLRHLDHARRDFFNEFLMHPGVHLQGPEVPAVDPDDVRTYGQSLVDALGTVDLHQAPMPRSCAQAYSA